VKFYLTPDGTYVGTQAECKAAGGDWRNPVEVPTDKDGLMVYLNELVLRSPKTEDCGITGLSNEQIDAVAAGSISPHEAKVLAAGGGEADIRLTDEERKELEHLRSLRVVLKDHDPAEAIHDADGAQFALYLEATLCRLGELRAEGWDGLRALARNHRNGRGSLERGLGYLLLEAPEAVEQ
jgi:hypothetical protein